MLSKMITFNYEMESIILRPKGRSRNIGISQGDFG